tara:strand:+ start:85 stop:264 length:180 start_codon:yes stop_codon:yes gene_type:complete
MKLNSLLYPAPAPSYKSNHFSKELVYIPRVFHRAEMEHQKELKIKDNASLPSSLLNNEL